MDIRIGIVSDIDFQAGTARVKMPDRDGVVSPPMRVLQAFTRDSKSYYMPAINEQVAYIAYEEGRAGVILGAIYSKRDETHADLQDEGKSGVVFSDGSRVIFDAFTSELIVDARSKVTVTADDEITATVDSCEITVNASEVIASKGTTRVRVAAKVNIQTAAGSLYAILNNTFTQLQAETHPTPAGPSGPPLNAAAYAAQQALLGQVMD